MRRARTLAWILAVSLPISAHVAAAQSCDPVLGTAAAVQPVPLAPGYGVTQPFNTTSAVQSCSLNVSSTPYGTYGSTMLKVLSWDPQTLLPDPTTVSLRTLGFSASSGLGPVRRWFDPPIVTARLPRLADPPRPTLALDYLDVDVAIPHNANADPDGSPAAPIAYGYGPGTTRTPLAGNHPVASFGICGGEGSYGPLYVLQSVMTVSTMLGVTYEQWIQRFRVMQPVAAEWVELAASRSSTAYVPSMEVYLFDSDGSENPALAVHALAPVTYGGAWFPTEWQPFTRFDQPVTLQPGHDYWLRVTTRHFWLLGARVITGTESSDFTQAIGPVYRRSTGTSPWELVPNRALNFRLLGTPVGALGVQPIDPVRAALQLSATPNPARGAIELAWSSGRSVARLEVFDTHGRLVRVHEPSAEASRWIWDARDRRGFAVRAGTYFVRARGADGDAAVERVTVVR